jgi:hypothetical protein
MFKYLLLLVALLPFATADRYDDEICADSVNELRLCERCCEEKGRTKYGVPYMVYMNAWTPIYPYTERQCICLGPAKMSEKALKDANIAISDFNQQQVAS